MFSSNSVPIETSSNIWRKEIFSNKFLKIQNFLEIKIHQKFSKKNNFFKKFSQKGSFIINFQRINFTKSFQKKKFNSLN